MMGQIPFHCEGWCSAGPKQSPLWQGDCHARKKRSLVMTINKTLRSLRLCGEDLRSSLPWLLTRGAWYLNP
jgi:hypothetical protein